MSINRLLLLALLLILLTGAACGSSSDATPTPEMIDFPTEFDERFTIGAFSGQNIVIDYSLTINNPGTGRLFIMVRAPDDEAIWQQVITEAGEGSITVPVQLDGDHQVLAAQGDLDGQFTIAARRTIGS